MSFSGNQQPQSRFQKESVLIMMLILFFAPIQVFTGSVRLRSGKRDQLISSAIGRLPANDGVTNVSVVCRWLRYRIRGGEIQ